MIGQLQHSPVRRIALAAKLAWSALRGAPQGRLYRYDPSIDGMRATLKGLTFAKLQTILDNAADGQIEDALALFDRMQRDARLLSVSATRRAALTGLKWEIVSAASQDDKIDAGAADEAADYVRERTDKIGLVPALKHMIKASGPNLAVLELVWEFGELVDIVPIPHWRLTINTQKSLAIRVLTAEERTYGVEAASPKFVVHIPEPATGSPLAGCRSEAQAWLYVQKRLALGDWGAFCELFGMPLRLGTYDKNASADEKKVLKEMLQNLGSRAWAMKSNSVQLELVESGQRGTSPYAAFVNYLDRETGILWLGANLTSDTTGGTGTFAAAKVQDEVRDDLRDGDIAAERLTVEQQIFTPIVRFRYPDRDMPVPVFMRRVPEDSKALAETTRAWQQAGKKVSRKWAGEVSGIPDPDPKATDDELQPPDAFEEGFSENV